MMSEPVQHAVMIDSKVHLNPSETAADSLPHTRRTPDGAMIAKAGEISIFSFQTTDAKHWGPGFADTLIAVTDPLASSMFPEAEDEDESEIHCFCYMSSWLPQPEVFHV